MPVYEVFRQEDEAGYLRHEGALDAPSTELAMQYAREIYSRRSEAIRLWVVPRDAIIEVADHDFLQPPLERTHRMGEGYRVTVAKRRQLRQNNVAEKEDAHDA